jgi:hypothetical protein
MNIVDARTFLARNLGTALEAHDFSLMVALQRSGGLPSTVGNATEALGASLKLA